MGYLIKIAGKTWTSKFEVIVMATHQTVAYICSILGPIEQHFDRNYNSATGNREYSIIGP